MNGFDPNGLMSNPNAQMLLGALGGILQSSAPSRIPVSSGQMLGQGLLGMQQGYMQAIQNGLLAEKIAEVKREKEAREAISESVGTLPQNYTPGAGQGMLENIEGSGYLGGQVDLRGLLATQAKYDPKSGLSGLIELEKARAVKSGESPAAVKEWEYLKKEFPDMTMDFPTYQSVKRAGYVVKDIGGVPSMAPTIPGKPVIPLSTLEKERQGQGAIAESVAAGKEYGKGIGEQTADAPRNLDAMTAIKDAKGMLDKGMYTGYWANVEKTTNKALPFTDKTKVENTEEFLSHIGNTVIPRLKEFGGNDTVEEMKYLQEVMAGNITLEKGSIKAILESAERKLERKMNILDERSKTTGLPGVPKATIKQWEDDNYMYRVLPDGTTQRKKK